MSFLGEIKRRKVFQVAAVYAVVAWLIVQVIATVEQPLSLPAWVATVVIVLLAAGFPIALILAWAFDVTPEGIKQTSGSNDSDYMPPATGHRLNYMTHGLVLIGVGFLVVDQYVFSPESATETADRIGTPASLTVRRTPLDIGPTLPISNTLLNAHVALSRDGSRMAYAKNVGSSTRLFVRELSQLEARAIPDSDGAQHPFFSPDGESVAFFSDGTDNQLKRVAFRGGPPQALADIQGAGGGFWGEDGYIVYSTNPGGIRSLLRIPATGGNPEFLIDPEPGGPGHVWPAALPTGNAILFVLRPEGTGPIRDGRIAALSLDTGEYRVLIEGAHRPQYLPTGHIAFVRSGALWAVKFDAEQLEKIGSEIPIVEEVQQNGAIGGAVFAFSDDGFLTYLPGSEWSDGGGTAPKDLVWVDRQGGERRLGLQTDGYWAPSLSPDGRQLALSIGLANQDIWIYDLERLGPTRLTFEEGGESNPIWALNGERVVYWSSRASEDSGLFWQAANGTGRAERLTVSTVAQRPSAFVPGRPELLVSTSLAGADISLLSLDDRTALDPLIQTEYAETHAAISPDGRWLAYTSNETGSFEIFLRRYPDIHEGKWLLSRDGGYDPHWSSDGSEIFFMNGNAVMAVSVEGDEAPILGAPTQLFSGDYWTLIDSAPNFDVDTTAEGERFLMMKPVVTDTNSARFSQQTVLMTVENWFEEVNRMAPAAE